jgi:electron transfer flavoprotein alpha subunit
MKNKTKIVRTRAQLERVHASLLSEMTAAAKVSDEVRGMLFSATSKLEASQANEKRLDQALFAAQREAAQARDLVRRLAIALLKSRGLDVPEHTLFDIFQGDREK